jgi:hypothetical protein
MLNLYFLSSTFNVNTQISNTSTLCHFLPKISRLGADLLSKIFIHLPSPIYRLLFPRLLRHDYAPQQNYYRGGFTLAHDPTDASRKIETTDNSKISDSSRLSVGSAHSLFSSYGFRRLPAKIHH